MAAGFAVVADALLGTCVQAIGDVLAGGEMLSRPTDQSVTVRAIAARALTASVEWRTDDDWRKSVPVRAEAADAFDIVIDSLASKTVNVYRLILAVSPEEVRVACVGAVAPGQDTATLRNGAVVTEYALS